MSRTETARHPWVAQTVIDTPLGTMTAAATAHGVAGLWFDGQKYHPGALALPHNDTQPHLASTRRWLVTYWRDKGSAADLPTFDLNGTPFQQAVWAALRALPFGQTCSYRELARRIGRPDAVRAVAAAVGRNPASLLVPCHRVIGSDGSLTGYAGGLQRKSRLLAHEAAA